ncbi:hypothetical protein LZ659_19625 [Shewanella indica]|uniref:Uncharacterized protein n=1 Tax=Shewanella indica TaxID=768528 RepID=A0ABU4QEW6_9GAMM|nr:hypothetical protein [Shewanella indica]MCE9793780.1 hypothetical protein [Shewanella indica]MDX6016834.1 hypothetical protein [Shewanella indica]
MKPSNLLLVASLALAAPLQAAEDPAVAEAIEAGLQHYRKGELSQASSQLDYASALIRQQRAGEVVGVFPEPLPGWQADEPASESGGMMLGGGINASRHYYKEDSARLEIELVLDSPLLQSVMAMLTNPSMITMSGGKLVKVQGHNAMLSTESGEPELTVIVNGNAMFTLSGEGVKVSELQAFANALQLDKL